MDIFSINAASPNAESNLFADQSSNNATQTVMNSTFTNDIKRSATLLLFSPKFMPDQFRRSHQYQFHQDFITDLSTTIEDSQRRSVNHTAPFMFDSLAAKAAILPTSQGSHVSMGYMSGVWTYILIIDNDNAMSPISGLSTQVPSRMLYSGWIMDEPCTSKAYSAQHVLNEAAVLSTTHHTTLSASISFGIAGSQTTQINTTGDFDYVGMVVNNLQTDGQSLFDLQPGSVTKATIPGQYMANEHSVIETPIIAAAKEQSVPIMSSVNSPSYHLRKIVSSTIEGVKLQTSREDNIFSSHDELFNTISGVMGSSQNTVLNQLNPEMPFTLGELMNSYRECLQVQIVRIPYDIQYDAGSAAAPSRRSVFTSLLSTSIPPLLTQWGLAELSFRYDSRAPIDAGVFQLGTDNEGVFKLFNISTLFPVDNGTMTSAWEYVQSYFRKTIAPVIKTNAGDFSVMVHCSIMGSTLIDLKIMDDVIENGLIETNNMFGGLNSPLLGDANLLRNNASQLYHTINAVADSASFGTPDYGYNQGYTLPNF